jgi:hypothetical protein
MATTGTGIPSRDYFACADFPCLDVAHARFTRPPAEVDPAAIRIAMIYEAPAPDPADDLWAPGEPFFWQTTRQAFAAAGVAVSAPADLLALGVYPTTTVKCAKTGYGVATGTIRACAEMILRRELALLPNLTTLLLMGDVAIKAVNHLARSETGKAVIPSGSTYKIRGPEYHWGTWRAFPSYLQTGKSYLIEASKRAMIAEDIRAALQGA